MDPLIVALLAVIVAGLLQYLVTNFISGVSTDIELINNQIGQVDKVEDLAVKYWLHDPAASSDNEKGLAACLNGVMTASALFELDAKRLMRRKYCKHPARTAAMRP